MNQATNNKSPRVVLITGTPAAGKTTISGLLAKAAGISHSIGTDTVRDILRTAISKKDLPTLHMPAILACDLAPENEDKKIWGFIEQAEILEKSVEAIVKATIEEKKDLILEGIHLIPGTLSKRDNINIFHIVLKVKDLDQLEKQMKTQHGGIAPYKLRNIDRAWAFQEYLVDKTTEQKSIALENLYGSPEKTAENIAKILRQSNA